MRTVLASTAVAAVLAGFVGVASVSALPTDSPVPERVGNFRLTDTTRLAHELYYFKYRARDRADVPDQRLEALARRRC